MMQGQVLEAFTVKMGTLRNADPATVYLVGGERRQLWSVRREDEDLRESTVDPGQDTADRVASSGETVEAHETLFTPGWDYQGKVLAVVELRSKRGGEAFSEEDDKRLAELGRSLGWYPRS